ncbi:hypothetical protein ACG916_08655 [Acinetobacter sp. ULE_I024]|uniref:phage tail fiber protein n=1 Tax=unclassified Acinetobacter TaxID=196816 RepID=UPI003AF7D31D
MAIQTINLGTAPSGAGGDTFRSTGTKLNENFTNNTHAASRYVGTQAENVMEVGAFGIGVQGYNIGATNINNKSMFFMGNDTSGFPEWMSGISMGVSPNESWQLSKGTFQNSIPVFRGTYYNGTSYVMGNWFKFWTQLNTTVDSNGFIKAASPIIKLFADKIESNDEALEQEPVFEKVDIGHYLLKNTEGFSDDGWYIEMPKDANGNVLVAVQYQQLEDNTIEVKTFAKKFDEETGDIVPNLEKPRDIPAGRWIDIRLKALPQPEIEIPKTPTEFQPTNLAQSVAEALKDGSEQ